MKKDLTTENTAPKRRKRQLPSFPQQKDTQTEPKVNIELHFSHEEIVALRQKVSLSTLFNSIGECPSCKGPISRIFLLRSTLVGPHGCEKNTWFCEGCGLGGDAIRAVMLWHGISHRFAAWWLEQRERLLDQYSTALDENTKTAQKHGCIWEEVTNEKR